MEVGSLIFSAVYRLPGSAKDAYKKLKRRDQISSPIELIVAIQVSG